MDYLVGDLQGCCNALERMLSTLAFSASRDRLFVLGDLVNRGPQSLATLKRLQSLGSAAICVLGNHDLHLLAVVHGVRKSGRKDTLEDILSSPERAAILHWLRHQRMACQDAGWLMVHAGVVPQWDAALTLSLAAEVETVLRSPDLPEFLHAMYGNEPECWQDDLQGTPRLRFIVNALTRIRFCTLQGHLDLSTSGSPDAAPQGLVPWFDVPDRRTQGTPIAFGHWSTLGLMQKPDLLCLDTGCVWGGKLSAMRVDGGRRELIQIVCDQAQKPGQD